MASNDKSRRTVRAGTTGDPVDPKAAESFLVKGTLERANGKPVRGATIRVYRKGIGSDQPLGRAVTTDTHGSYEFQYRSHQAGKGDHRGLDLIVRAFDRKDQELIASPVIFDAKPVEKVDLRLPAESADHGPSEVEALMAALALALDGTALDQLTVSDVEYLAGRTGQNAANITLLVQASRLALATAPMPGVGKASRRASGKDASTATISVMVFYGWLRQGLPSEPDALWQRSDDEFARALMLAIGDHIVPASLARQLKAIAKAVQTARVNHQLEPAPHGEGGTLGALLGTMPRKLSVTKTRVLAEALNQEPSDGTALEKRLRKAGFDATEIADVRVTRALGDLTGQHAPLVESLQQLRPDSTETSLRFLAARRPLQWLELVDNHGVSPSLPLSPEAYAERLEQMVDAAHPTAVFAARVIDGVLEIRDPAVRQAAMFLAEHPNLELTRDNARRYLASTRRNGVAGDTEALIGTLERIQRVRKVSGGWKEAGALLDSGFHSAGDIVSRGPEGFAAAMGPAISVTRAREIFETATDVHDTTVAVLGNVITALLPAETFAFPGTHGDGKADPATHPGLRDYPNLRRLFGNLDSCQCRHCQSVLGPAAYLVDLLRFLDAPLTTPGGPTPLASLLQRRPDLADLELSCANTNTEIPYVDLVVEILENAAALPLDVAPPYGFDPAVDFAGTLTPNVAAALRQVLARSATTIGETLRVRRAEKQLLIGNHQDWLVTDGSRTWTLRFWPQSLAVSLAPPQFKILGLPVPVTDYPAAIAALDLGQLPDRGWLSPGGGDPARDVNLPFRGAPVVTTASAGHQWTVQGTRAVRVRVVMAAPMGAVILEDDQGQQVAAVQTTTGVLQRLVAALARGELAEPLSSMLPSTLSYQITLVGTAWDIVYGVQATLSYRDPGLAITALTYQNSGSHDNLQASPENQNPEAYRKLSAAVFPWSLPLDLWGEQVRAFLAKRGVPRRRFMEERAPASRLLDDAAADPIAAEVMNLSQMEWEILAGTAAGAQAPWSYWGLAENDNAIVDRTDESMVSGPWVTILARVSILLQQSGLSYGELLNVLESRVVRAAGAALAPRGTGCDVTALALPGLTPGHLDRIHRFVRLARKLGWSFADLDRAIAVVTNGGMAFTAATLRGLSHLARLQEMLQVPVGIIATWWGTSITESPIDHTTDRPGAPPSIYQSLFQSRGAFNPPDPDFALDRLPTLAVTLLDKSAQLGSAFAIKAAEVAALTAAVTTGAPTLSLPNLVSLYRHRSVARALGLSIADHLRALRIIDVDPFRSPAALVEFVEAVRWIQNGRFEFTLEECEYLLRYPPVSEPTPLLDPRWVRQVLSDVRDSIQGALRELTAATPAGDRLRATLVRLGWDEMLIAEAVTLFGSSPTFTTQLPTGGAVPTVTIPAVLADGVFYVANVRQLTLVGMLTPTEWTAFSTANAANGTTVQIAITQLRADADAFAATLPAAQHQLQSFRLPIHRVSYGTGAPPVIPVELRSRCYVDVPAGEIALAGWLTVGDERALQGVVAPTVVQALRTASDQYIETDPLNRLIGPNDLPVLFRQGQTPETRIAAVLESAAPWLARQAASGALATAFNLEPAIVGDLLLRQLDRTGALDPMLSSAFINADARVEITPTAFPLQYTAMAKLHKAALVAGRCRTKGGEVAWLQAARPGAGDPPSFDVLALAALPVTVNDPPASFAAFRRLVQLFEVRDDRRLGSGFLARLATGLTANDRTGVQGDLANRLQLSTDDVVTAATALGLVWPDDYRNPRRLGQLLGLLFSIRTLGVKASDALTLAGPLLGPNEATVARNLLRGRTDAASWPKELEPIEDILRDRRRAGLVDWLVARDGLRDASELYDRYLVDVEMGTCKDSTRILLAISAVQLFVQRCLLNLEDGIAPAAIDADRWRWMKNYRVWEANRKVFLYPENWIEPELRDDKSEFFRELEGQLLQQDLDAERAEEILKAYLTQLEDVSRLTIVGTYLERTIATNGLPGPVFVHVVGRTHNRPSRFYYRRWLLSPTVNRWTPWERVPLDGVTTDHVLPFVMQGDAYIAWPEMTQLPSQPDPADTAAAGPKWRLQLAWIRRASKGWTDRYLAADTLEHPWVVGKNENQSFSFRIRETIAGTTEIECYGAQREGALSYAPIPLDDIAPVRINFPIPSNAPWVNISVSGLVYGSYQNNTVFLPIAGAQIRFGLVFTGGSDDDKYWGPRDRAWDLNSNDLKLYGNHDSDAGFTYANGAFFQSLALVAQDPDRGFYRPKLLNCIPEFRLEVTLSDGRTRSVSFPYFDPQLGQGHYSEEKFRKNFVFEMPGVPPGAESERPVTMKPIGLFRLLAGEDAQLLPLAAAPLASPSGMLTYASGYRAESANPNGALTVPGTGLTVWQGVAARYALLPNAPAHADRLPEVLVYSDPSDSYFIRRQEADTDSAAVQGEFQVVLHGHPTAGALRRLLNQSGVAALFGLPQQTWSDPLTFAGHTPGPEFDAGHSLTTAAIRFDPDESQSPYAAYNTELFFHVPFLIARYLSNNQRFDEARDWFHLLFDPTTSDNAPAPARYWRYLPFRIHSTTDPIDQLLTALVNPAVSDTDPRRVAVRRQIAEWLENPFRPHAVARLRPRAYQFAVVFKYLDNLLAWADRLFRQSTTESINEATQLYILAAKLLGPRPRTIPPAVEPPPITYRAAAAWNEFSNAWAEVEANLSLPVGGGRFKAAMPTGLNVVASIGMPYFCVPGNDRLQEYWDTLEGRLFNIRHCRNIDGVEQPIPLFQPPIDPALLVRAAAAGLDIDSVLADVNGPIPHYRFTVMAQKATELGNEVRALGGALLAVLEKKDAEELALLRSSQEIELLDQVRVVKERQIDEAKANIEALRQGERLAISKFQQYQRLLGNASAVLGDDPGADVEQVSLVRPSATEGSPDLGGLGMTQAELDQIRWSEIALLYGVTAGMHSTLASIFFAIPQIHAGSPVFNAEFGGQNLGHLMNAGGAFWGTLERAATHRATRASTVGGYQRRQDEWVFQSRLALREIQQIRKQIIAADIRQAIAEQELVNHDKQVKNSKAADQFMRDKYTNTQLYQWMAGQISAVYFSSYQLALETAKRAERAFRHELGIADSNYIGAAYWDNLKKGLMAGDRLLQDIKRLEVAYLDQNRREYEITKHVSLQQLDPTALIALRETGQCDVNLPEALFDLDFPGHYLRRLKMVGLTIPCVTGPYTGVPCTLALLRSEIRRTATPGRTYARDTGNDDPRFVDLLGAVQSIVTSGGQNDAGLFEPNLRDDRYLPFEGAGAISQWRLSLPTGFPTFDYDTITDVVLHLRYTARDGGVSLQRKAEGELAAAVNTIVSAAATDGMSRLFSLRREFPTEWHRFTSGPATATANQEFVLDKSRFPLLLSGKAITITKTAIYAVPDRDTGDPAFPAIGVTLPGAATASTMLDGATVGRLLTKTIEEEVVVGRQAAQAIWKLSLPAGDVAAFKAEIDDILIVCHYRVG